jgi:hypothetical protein
MDETNIVSLGTGPLGGKGRGCAFINTLIYNLNFPDIIPDLNIRTPRTCIVGNRRVRYFHGAKFPARGGTGGSQL